MAKFSWKRTSKIPKITSKINFLLDQVALSAAGQIQEHAANRMRGGGPSLAGRYPAVDTGLLRGTLGHKRIKEMKAIVYSPMEYAPHLEFGTVKMAARPFLRPSTDAIRPSFRSAIASAMRRGATA